MVEVSDQIVMLCTSRTLSVLIYDLNRMETLKILTGSDRVAGCLCPLGVRESLYPRYVLIKGALRLTMYDTQTRLIRDVAA